MRHDARGHHGAQVLLTPHHGITTAAGEVVAITDDEVTLTMTAAGQRLGTYGLIWDSADGPQTGSAIVGPVSGTTQDSVTRPITAIRGDLPVGTAVLLDPNLWNSDPQTALGIEFSTIDISGELDVMPAWRVDGEGSM